jgi:hypothetical protein
MAKNNSTRRVRDGKEWERTVNLGFSSVAATVEKAVTYVIAGRRQCGGQGFDPPLLHRHYLQAQLGSTRFVQLAWPEQTASDGSETVDNETYEEQLKNNSKSLQLWQQFKQDSRPGRLRL